MWNILNIVNVCFYLVQDCVGAIDGTHIPAWAPASQHDAFWNRHGELSQNVMATCDLDMRFVFVYADCEGSAHDAAIFQNAISNTHLGFPMPPQGKYYVVDSAYKNMPGFLAPFRGHRYHQNEFGPQSGNPRNLQELFNHRHSSVRNVVERTFGVFKKRFQFLCGPMQNFKMKRQVDFVIACCAVHNFIIETNPNDPYFPEFDSDNITHYLHQAEPSNHVHLQEIDQSHEGIECWNAYRLAIARQLWNSQNGSN